MPDGEMIASSLVELRRTHAIRNRDQGSSSTVRAQRLPARTESYSRDFTTPARLAASKAVTLITWFFTCDFDAAWAGTHSTCSDAAVIRLFRDLGLRDGVGVPRPSHALRLESLARSSQARSGSTLRYNR
jgi:hypothetical protein